MTFTNNSGRKQVKNQKDICIRKMLTFSLLYFQLRFDHLIGGYLDLYN